MADLHVNIVTPEAEVYSGPASEVSVPGWEGEFDVLPGHDMFLSLLRGGIVTVSTPQGKVRYIVGRGFAEANQEQVTLLTDSCILADDADKSTAQADLNASEAELAGAAFGTPAWDAAVEKHELAAARLKA